MKKTELVFIGLFLLAGVLKIFHLPGSGILTVLTLGLISCLYFYFGFALFNDVGFRKMFKKASYQGISTMRILGGIATGIALSVIVVGILFKLQSWPGSALQIMVGVICIGVIAAISLIKLAAGKGKYYTNILKRVVLFGTIAIFLMLIPFDVWLNWKYPNHPEYVNAVLEAEADPSNEVLWEKVEEERRKMYEGLNNPHP